jgi:MerR family transcriptional regulator/heat shock protein HspR
MAMERASRRAGPEQVHEELGCFFISVAARILGVHPQTLRYYERAGLIRPSRSQGNIRLYSTRDLEQAQLIKRWIEEFGVNLAGVEVMLRMRAQIDELQREVEELRAALRAVRR